MTQTAFVSGATGYIAQHLIKLLLSKGYHVVGSVRTAEKGEHLKTLFKSGFEYEIVPDLKEGSFDEALQKHPETTVFYHNASPVFIPTENFQETIINPAVEGTRSALEAAHKYGKNVKKFVLTSSIAAIVASSKPEDIITEETWSEFTKESSVADGLAAYSASKTFGERAAWKFIEETKPSFTFATVNPFYVFGPQAFDSEVKPQLNASAEYVNQVLKLKANEPLPVFEGGAIDVRDVARAHLIAGESDTIINKRLLLQNGPFSSQTISNVIHKNFPELDGKISKGDPTNVYAGGFNFDDNKTRKLLGFEYIKFEKTIVDSVLQLLATSKLA